VGVGLALLVHELVPSLPVLIRPWTIAVSFSFAMAVGLFFGVYPAKKAADLDPIEALRYE
jgi:putative ABC transport system permease protein